MSTPRYHGKRTAPRRRPAPRGRPRADQKLTPQQCRRTVQLMVAGGIFVLLVMLKLLLPQRLSGFALTMRESLRQDADFRAAFAAVGLHRRLRPGGLPGRPSLGHSGGGGTHGAAGGTPAAPS